MVQYNQEDAAALAGLVTRYTRMWNARDADRRLKAEIDARLESYVTQFKQIGEAFALFGVTGMTKANWDALKEDLGHDLWYAAVDRAFEAAVPHAPKSLLPPTSPDNVEVEESDEAPQVVAGTVREIVLEQLKLAGTKGAKAGALRELIEGARGTQLHEKTVGMTLYRLSNAGLARREGRTWFYVPQSAETKNPGGETPGPINRDNEKGEEP